MIYFGFGFALLNNVRLRNIFKKDSYNEISTLRILGGIFTGFILSLLSIYSLFKFQRWPFANEGLLISLYGLLPIIAIVTFKFASSKKSFYSSLLIRLLIFGVIGTSLYFLTTEKILEMRNRDFPEIKASKLTKDLWDIILQSNRVFANPFAVCFWVHCHCFGKRNPVFETTPITGQQSLHLVAA